MPATVARIRIDGRLVKVLKDGSEVPFPKAPARYMTEEEVQAAAKADPDARPMTEEEWRQARRVPRVKTLRRALLLTPEEFTRRWHISLENANDRH